MLIESLYLNLMVVHKLLEYIRSRAFHHGKKIVYHAKNLHHHAKRIVHHSHDLMHMHRFHFLTYAHILLLLALFGFYHLNGIMFADEANIPVAIETVTSSPSESVSEPIVSSEVTPSALDTSVASSSDVPQ